MYMLCTHDCIRARILKARCIVCSDVCVLSYTERPNETKTVYPSPSL